MKAQKYASKKPIFFRFLFTYLAMLVFPVAISIMVYAQTYKKTEDITQKASLLGLEQSRAILEQRFSEIGSMAYELYNNPYAIRFSKAKGTVSGHIPSLILETQNRLPSYKISNNFILDYFIAFPGTNTILNKNIAYSLPAFFNNYLQYNTVDYETFRNTIFNTSQSNIYWPVQPVVQRGMYSPNFSFDSIEVFTCLPVIGRSEEGRNMNVIMLISRNALDNIMSPALHSADSYIALAATNGTLLYENSTNSPFSNYLQTAQAEPSASQGSTYYINGKKVFITQIYSDKLSMSFISIRPYSVIMAELQPIKHFIFFSVALSAILGVGLAFFFSSQRSGPAMSLYYDNEQFQAQINEQKPILENTFLERLLNGTLANTHVNTMIQYLNIPPDKSWRCLVLQFFDDEKLNVAYFEQIKILVLEVLNSFPGLMQHDIGSYRIACIIASDAGDYSEKTAILLCETINTKLAPLVSCKIATAIGRGCSSIQAVSQSLRSALSVLNFKDWNLPYQILFAESESLSPNGESRSEEIIALMVLLQNCLKSGNTPELENVFAQLENNFKAAMLTSNTSSLNMLTFFLLNILSDEIENGSDINSELLPKLEHISRSALQSPTWDNILRLKKLCMSAANNIEEMNSGRTGDMVEHILQFVRQHYTNPNLSLTMIADQYGISEPYLSQLFKKYSGTNISIYIESLRFEKAKELLSSTNFTIQQITEQIGYNSPNTFNKAFKKNFGISPSVYRQMHCIQ